MYPELMGRNRRVCLVVLGVQVVGRSQEMQHFVSQLAWPKARGETNLTRAGPASQVGLHPGQDCGIHGARGVDGDTPASQDVEDGRFAGTVSGSD